ncbi:MAG TPA: nickel-dependent lactate racemase [Synergistaceae bacterium]|nr:nickel-dependent lactate racemase [Synergistaceae bacterium]
MASYTLPYGKNYRNVELPPSCGLQDVLDLPPQEEISEEAVIRRALENPIGTSRLRDMVSPGESVCIVVSDITRAWQRMGVYLPYLVEELEAGGVRDGDMHFLCSTGTHRSQTEEEHRFILGPELADRFTLIDHDCRDEKALVFLGTTSFGTPVKIHKLALECDHLVLTGVVAYHVMAGWGGGRKSVLPGIAAYESVQANHSLALHPGRGKGRNPRVRCGNFEDNPVHLDMVEGCALAKPDFLFNVIMGSRGIAGAVSGHWQTAYEEGVRLVEAQDGVPIPERRDLVIASAGGYPKDLLFYQASKAIFNASEAVRDGGVLIVLAECSEGLGSEEFLHMLTAYPEEEKREDALRQDFSIARYVGYLLREYTSRCRVILVSSLDPSGLEGSAITVVPTLEEALELARPLLPRESAAYILPHGGSLFPKNRSSSE